MGNDRSTKQFPLKYIFCSSRSELIILSKFTFRIHILERAWIAQRGRKTSRLYIHLFRLFQYILKQWIVFPSALIGYSNSRHPVLFTVTPPAPPSERRQTRVSYEQNGFSVYCRKQTNKIQKKSNKLFFLTRLNFSGVILKKTSFARVIARY